MCLHPCVQPCACNPVCSPLPRITSAIHIICIHLHTVCYIQPGSQICRHVSSSVLHALHAPHLVCFTHIWFGHCLQVTLQQPATASCDSLAVVWVNSLQQLGCAVVLCCGVVGKHVEHPNTQADQLGDEHQAYIVRSALWVRALCWIMCHGSACWICIIDCNWSSC
jgi:hypothetical protein